MRYRVDIYGVIHTSLPRGLCHDRLRTTSCQVPSRTTNNRKCSHNNANMRRCSRMRARPFAYTRRHMDATQISSAITQNANRARKRGLPFCPPSLRSQSVRPSRSENRSEPVAHTTAHTNFTKWRVHRKDYLCRACFWMSGAAFVYRADYWGYKSKSWTKLYRKMRITTHVVGCTLARKITRVCVGGKMCVDFFFIFRTNG